MDTPAYGIARAEAKSWEANPKYTKVYLATNRLLISATYKKMPSDSVYTNPPMGSAITSIV